MDPDTYLPDPESKDFQNRLRLINSLTGIRNILVFSPVAITWAAISVVTSSFSKFEQENPKSIVNFLEFWQQGFGYLNDFWRLSNVAIFDAILVSIVIALTFAINLSTKKSLEDELVERERIQASRAELIFTLNEFFYLDKYPTERQINRNFYSASKSLDKTLKSLSKLVGRLEKDLAKYPDTKKVVVELKNLNTEIKRINKK